MSAQEILNLVMTICCLIGVIGGLIPTGISLYKKIKEIVKNKDWMTIMKVAQSAMSEVEKYALEHPDMTSEQKLEMAINSVKASLTAMGVEYSDETMEKLKDYINDLIKWSKTVNSK